MLKIVSRPVGDFAVNTILVWCPVSRKAIIFDPGGESEKTIRLVEQEKLDPIALVNTHGHVDHIAENGRMKQHFGIPLLVHSLDRPMLTDPVKNMSSFISEPVISPDADQIVEDGDVLAVGDEALTAIHVPGHTQGSLAFYQPRILIAGDTLFAGGVGRSDLPGGDEPQLYASIRSRIYSLPEETVVYPGHGPTTTVGIERRSNPFVRA